mmetsp:Transcript_3029/g.9440  ORF Transcript_3029/g.9440 Transcript_3029/m.9440 type:complete len:209 (-) Transcript_3029:596-1222(-)
MLEVARRDRVSDTPEAFVADDDEAAVVEVLERVLVVKRSPVDSMVEVHSKLIWRFALWLDFSGRRCIRGAVVVLASSSDGDPFGPSDAMHTVEPARPWLVHPFAVPRPGLRRLGGFDLVLGNAKRRRDRTAIRARLFRGSRPVATFLAFLANTSHGLHITGQRQEFVEICNQIRIVLEKRGDLPRDVIGRHCLGLVGLEEADESGNGL